MINVKKQSENDFIVDVEVDGYKTTHKVHMDDDYYKKLTEGRISKEELIRRSFEFLLDRESNRTILSRFDLKVINRYFPTYESVMKNQI